MRLSRNRAARRRLATLAGAALAAFVVGLIAGGGGGDGEREPTPEREEPAPPARALEAVDRLSLRQQVGQVTISTFPDPTVPDYIRRRLRAGETAGVILFSRNADSSDEWAALTRSLQRIAGDSALVMVDQEGGDVRTVTWAGPEASQPLQGGPAAVRRAARSAARQLRAAGVNVDLAPVADVPGGGGSPVMGSRSFAGDAAGIAARTRASIEGMEAARVAPTAKHFPGLGRAQVNTDDGPVTLEGAMDDDLVPFRAAIEADVPLVMLSHALYPALDDRRIASQSPRIVTGLLRDELGYDGVVVTDSIEAQAVLDRSNVATAAERSLRAGVDLILTTGSASWNDIYPRLLRHARRSKAFRQRIRESAARVLALKERLGLSATPGA